MMVGPPSDQKSGGGFLFNHGGQDENIFAGAERREGPFYPFFDFYIGRFGVHHLRADQVMAKKTGVQ